MRSYAACIRTHEVVPHLLVHRKRLLDHAQKEKFHRIRCEVCHKESFLRWSALAVLSREVAESAGIVHDSLPLSFQLSQFILQR